jgi:Zn-dependent protease/CBS domain-containing protein
MKWSLKLGTLAGVPVYVHATFALLLGWIGLVNWMTGQTVAAAVSGVAFVLAIFVCVVLHELGHALAARRFGVPTRDITLYPIGGVARLERMPEKPAEELWVAIAGPAVNVAVAAALALWLFVTGGFEPLGALGVARGSFIERLMVVNILLIAFNMIPAFPMDGGRVLRSLLAMRMDYSRATGIAARIGQAFALAFAFAGFFFNPFLVVIAFFVWMGAGHEARFTRMRTALEGIPVAHAMRTRYRTLHPEDHLGNVVDVILAGAQTDFPVVARGRVVGLLAHDRLAKLLASHGAWARVGDVMETDVASVQWDQPLASVAPNMLAGGVRLIPVLQHGALVGILTGDSLSRFLELHRALHHGGGSSTLGGNGEPSTSAP